MGKIKKIKAERKRAEVEKNLKRALSRKRFALGLVVLVVLLAVGGGGFYGYRFLNAKYKVGEKVAGYFKKKNKEGVKVEKKTYLKAPEMQINPTKKYTAKFQTSKGDFEIELLAQKAPKTVNNFVFLSKEGFYDGLIFHRVINDFMIQGGDPQGTGMGGPGYKFDDEINDVKLVKGVLAMANSGLDEAGKGTNGSQFFIVTKDAADWLDGKHTAFGRVTKGMDVVLDIQSVEVGANDRPTEEVVVKKISITEE